MSGDSSKRAAAGQYFLTKRSSLHKPDRVLLSEVTHVMTRLEPARWTTVVAGGKGMIAEVCCSGKEPWDVQCRR